MVLSMRCAISPHSIKVSQLLLAAMPKTASTASSLKPIWEAIAGSFKKLADKKKGVLFVLAGDLEYFASEFGWPTAMSNYPCPFCKADNFFDMTKTKCPFTDFRKDALWKATLRSWHETPPNEAHPLYQVPGVSFWSLKMDLLHLVDLGVASHVYGNLFALLDQKTGKGKKAGVVELNRWVAAKYQELGVRAGDRIPRLNTSDIYTDDFPCLRHVKGRRVRKFAPVATLLAKGLATSEKGQHIHLLCQLLEEAYDFCDRKEYVWPDKIGKAFEEKVNALLAHYGWLAKDSMKSGNSLWSIVQKHHLMAHYPAQCRYLAPRACWAYGGESFMSLLVAVAAASVKSTPAWMLPGKVLNKFGFAFHLVLEGVWNPELEDAEAKLAG